ncbi:MAG: hypothetical protein ACPGED_06580 [Flavobacteriales bacterium]
MKRILLLCSFSFFFSHLLAQYSNCDCCTMEHNEFNYWVGEWEVRDSIGTLLGTSTITKSLDNCLIEEHWKGTSGSNGKSMNYYSSSDSLWHQVWIDNNGKELTLTGKGEEDVMIMQSEILSGEDGDYRNQILWIQRDAFTVEQYWFLIDMEGTRLQQLFFGIYSHPAKD